MILNANAQNPLTEVIIPVTYQQEWQDGFAARGWKLDCSMDDPFVIAATAETGPFINTSVLVHDMLDHYLCGLPMSGHRNEAIALIQLASRTGTDPTPDFAQMVNEDLMQGQVNGEPLLEFLSQELRMLLPINIKQGKDIIQYLKRTIGAETLHKKLIQCFFDIGKQNERSARQHYQQSGLDYQKRAALGEALQQLLLDADAQAMTQAGQRMNAKFILQTRQCALQIQSPFNNLYTQAYH